jgi:nucleotide-binding universal stress UspA family protein
MTKRVIVGFDSSHASTLAARWASDEAVLRGCPLHVVACFAVPLAGDLTIGWSGTEAYSMILQATEASLTAVKAQLAERHPELEVTTDCTPEGPAWALVHEAHDDDLIVVGAGHHRDAAAFWLGSTARAVIRKAPCPVVVVRGDGSSRPDRVVVGVDGSDASDDAVRWAADEADRHRVPLVVVHSWDYPYVLTTLEPTLEAAAQDQLPGRALAQIQACELMQIDAANVLEAGAELARELCGSNVETMLVEGSPASALLSTVRDGDLLVIGSRGRGAVTAGLFGSTANAVLDAAAIPVVVVKDAK